jgi:hypothetical protein
MCDFYLWQNFTTRSLQKEPRHFGVYRLKSGMIIQKLWKVNLIMCLRIYISVKCAYLFENTTCNGCGGMSSRKVVLQTAFFECQWNLQLDHNVVVDFLIRVTLIHFILVKYAWSLQRQSATRSCKSWNGIVMLGLGSCGMWRVVDQY